MQMLYMRPTFWPLVVLQRVRKRESFLHHRQYIIFINLEVLRFNSKLPVTSSAVVLELTTPIMLMPLRPPSRKINTHSRT